MFGAISTGCSIPNDNLDVVKRITQRGGKVRFVNPRKVESSTVETGPTIQIRPGTDVYFLAAVLNEIKLHGGCNSEAISQYGKNINKLTDFIQRYPAERVARITGVSVETICSVAQEIMSAKLAA